MNKSKAGEMIARLLSNSAGLQYGAVSVTANVHNGRIVNVVYTVTENTRETEAKENGEKDIL